MPISHSNITKTHSSKEGDEFKMSNYRVVYKQEYSLQHSEAVGMATNKDNGVSMV